MAQSPNQLHAGQNIRNEINFEELSIEKGASFNNLVEEVTQTFTTMRDIKRKEALQELDKLAQTAESFKLLTEAAYEAVQRYKALINKKYELQFQIQQMRNNSMQRAQNDQELEQTEQIKIRVTQMAVQAKEQITVEIKRFKQQKSQSTQKLISEFTQIMRESADLVQ